jgi:hypothetical protein
MRELKHPVSHAIYGVDEKTGLVCVQDKGRTGLYSPTGVWQSGEQFDVDPCMCQWIGGPQADPRYAKPFKSL